MHPVRRSDEEFSVGRNVAAVGEVEDAGVLQEPADNRAHTDVVCASGDSRTQTAELRERKSSQSVLQLRDAEHNAWIISGSSN